MGNTAVTGGRAKGTYDAYVAILEEELVCAMGCTEPIAVAYCAALARTWLEIATNIEPTRRAGADVRRARVRDALSFMEARYSEALSLSDLADAAHVSVSELGRDFRACLGTTPWRHLTEYRLDRAARLLRATRLPVATVAARTGFASPSHFGKLFRERTGLSPRAYRTEKMIQKGSVPF